MTPPSGCFHNFLAFPALVTAEVHDVTSITLALRTLGSFDFEGQRTFNFIFDNFCHLSNCLVEL